MLAGQEGDHLDGRSFGRVGPQDDPNVVVRNTALEPARAQKLGTHVYVCVPTSILPPDSDPPILPPASTTKVTLCVCFSLRSAVWSVSWSVTGGILAVAGGDNQVTLWRESHVGEWVQIGALEEGGGGLLPSS